MQIVKSHTSNIKSSSLHSNIPCITFSHTVCGYITLNAVARSSIKTAHVNFNIKGNKIIVMPAKLNGFKIGLTGVTHSIGLFNVVKHTFGEDPIGVRFYGEYIDGELIFNLDKFDIAPNRGKKYRKKQVKSFCCKFIANNQIQKATIKAINIEVAKNKLLKEYGEDANIIHIKPRKSPKSK